MKTHALIGAMLLLNARQAIEGDFHGDIARAIEGCQAQYQSGQFKTYSETVVCENQAHSAVLMEYRYPFMQSSNVYHLEKTQIAQKLDAGKISKEEAMLQFARASEEFESKHQQNLQGMYNANAQNTQNMLGTMILYDELQKRNQPPAPQPPVNINCSSRYNQYGQTVYTHCH